MIQTQKLWTSRPQGSTVSVCGRRVKCLDVCEVSWSNWWILATSRRWTDRLQRAVLMTSLKTAPATDHPQMTSKAIFQSHQGSTAQQKNKPLQPEYRHTTVTTASLSSPCWSIAMSACHSVGLKSALMEIWSGKHATLQNQPGGPARQRACSRVTALMCEQCGRQWSDQSAW